MRGCAERGLGPYRTGAASLSLLCPSPCTFPEPTPCPCNSGAVRGTPLLLAGMHLALPASARRWEQSKRQLLGHLSILWDTPQSSQVFPYQPCPSKTTVARGNPKGSQLPQPREKQPEGRAGNGGGEGMPEREFPALALPKQHA